MTFTQLEYFVEVVRTGSFSRVAENLYISQPALSKAIKALENDFHVQLLNRNGKKMVPTKDGQILFEHAQKIIENYRRQIKDLEEALQTRRVTIRLGIPPTAGAMGFFNIISQFKQSHPNVDVEIKEMTSTVILNKLRDGELDFGVVVNPVPDERLGFVSVCDSEAILIVSPDHPLACRDEVPFRELEDEKFLLISSEYMFYNVVMNKFKEARIDPEVAFTSYHWEGLCEMVASGLGVGIFPKPLIHRFNKGQVKEISLKNPSFPYSLSLAYRKDKLRSLCKEEFLDLCIRSKIKC